MAPLTADDELDRMAGYFRGLADPTRLAIVRCLIAGGELSVGEIVATTTQTQANTSKHLKAMTGAGLLSRRKGGLRVYYRLADPVVEQIFRLVSNALRGETGP